MPTVVHTAALVAGFRRIDRYRGDRVSEAGADFVRAVVRDAMHAAPVTVNESWVNSTLHAVNRLVVMSETAGVALTREAVFSERNRNRLIFVECARLATMSRANYRSRLNVVAAAISGGPQAARLASPPISAHDVLRPYETNEITDLRTWALGLRPASRRARLNAFLDLGLGIGVRRREITGVHGTDVTKDDNGVHVRVGGTFARRVTCSAAHEANLWASAQAAGENLLLSPTRTTLHEGTVQHGLNQLNGLRPPAPIMLRRLRNTWLIQHMLSGTNLAVLLPAAGLIGMQHLNDLIPFLPVVDGATASLALRQVTR
jgi:integrase